MATWEEPIPEWFSRMAFRVGERGRWPAPHRSCPPRAHSVYIRLHHQVTCADVAEISSRR